MQAVVHWTTITNDDSDLWRLTCGLYAYLAPNSDEILYIGKVDGTTVRQRWNRSGKEGFWNYIEEERGFFEHSVIVGEVELPKGCRLTRQVLADIESLLINNVIPCGNIQCRNTRISRPGLSITCKGNWPLNVRRFID